MILGQLEKLTGLSSAYSGAVQATWDIVRHLGDASAATMAVGVSSFVVLMAFRRFLPRWPGALVVVVLGSRCRGGSIRRPMASRSRVRSPLGSRRSSVRASPAPRCSRCHAGGGDLPGQLLRRRADRAVISLLGTARRSTKSCWPSAPKRRVWAAVDGAPKPVRHLVLDAAMNQWASDASAVEAVREVHRPDCTAATSSSRARATDELREQLAQTGLTELIGSAHFHATVTAAVEACVVNPPVTRGQQTGKADADGRPTG